MTGISRVYSQIRFAQSSSGNRPTHEFCWATPLDTQPELLEIDLDACLRFARGLVVVTSERLLVMPPGDSRWQSWAYRPGLSLSRRDHSGVGTLELCDEDSLLAHWRYTLGADIAAGRLVEHFTRQLSFRITGSAASLVRGALPEVRNPAARRAGRVPGVQQGNP
jgi:hypothetical protein